jgi:hypothetical protein
MSAFVMSRQGSTAETNVLSACNPLLRITEGVLDCVWAGRVVGFVSVNVTRTKLVGIALVIFAATVWLYWPSVHGEFLGGDDNEYLRQSERWNGVTWNAVTWAFTSTDSFYHPLPRLSHVLDYQIWGRNVVGHHVTSLVVHALNAALVFGFLWTLFGATALSMGERLTVALWVAAVFAIHPLQVESVAWISGRTQVLCTTFGIACLWAYAAGARRWGVWGLYVGALLCKPMAVSLPFVMLAMDYYPLQRYKQLGWGRLVREKAVMIVIAVAAGVATMVIRGDRVATLGAAPLSQRPLFLCQSLVFYPSKLIWPSHLAVMYPMRLLSLSQGWVLAWVLTVLMVTVVVVYERRRNPVLLATCGAYALLLLPVSGLVPTDSQVVELCVHGDAAATAVGCCGRSVDVETFENGCPCGAGGFGARPTVCVWDPDS